MQTGLGGRASDAEVSEFSERVFALLEFEVVVDVQNVEHIGRELNADLDALLGEDLPLRVSWFAEEAGPLVVDVSEPFPAFEQAGVYHQVGLLRPFVPRELAVAVGEEVALREIEDEIEADRPTGSGGGTATGMSDCHEGRVGKTALCLFLRASHSGQNSMPPLQEVRRLVAQFLDEHADRLPKSRALHQRLHESRVVDASRGVEGARSVVRSPYSRDAPDGADGTAVVLTVSCLSCQDFPVPGTVTAVVFVPLRAWSPGDDGSFRVWPPSPQARVHYTGAVPPTLGL